MSYHSDNRDAESQALIPSSSSSSVRGSRRGLDGTDSVGEDELSLSVGGYSFKDLGRIGILLMGALLLSVFAFSNVKQDYNRTTNDKFDVFKITSFDSIPKDAIFGNFSTPAQQKLFAMFLEKYSKGYDASQYGEMFKTFKFNLDKIDNRNAAESARGGTARHGINKFTGWTEEELAKLRGAKKPEKSSSDKTDSSGSSDSITTKLNKRGVATPTSVALYSGTATSKDWSDVYTTAVRDQGYCGGCWAFSAVAQMESDGIRQGLLSASDALSPQQLISCSSDNDGCSGGWTEFAFSYSMTTGIELDSDYPYTAYDEKVDQCDVSTSKEIVQVDSFYLVQSEDSMIDYVMETGPLSVCVDSSEWDSYVDGIVSSCGTNVDHCVQVVGVDLGEGAWKIRNSWGTDWGEGGYIRLKSGQNTCGISEDPIYTTVSLLQTVSKNGAPTAKPTNQPTTSAELPEKPTSSKTTDRPSAQPTPAVTQSTPTATVPTLASPSTSSFVPTPLTPSLNTPTSAGQQPSAFPTLLPTLKPSLPVVLSETKSEMVSPTSKPTGKPTLKPVSPRPTSKPSSKPSSKPISLSAPTNEVGKKSSHANVSPVGGPSSSPSKKSQSRSDKHKEKREDEHK